MARVTLQVGLVGRQVETSYVNMELLMRFMTLFCRSDHDITSFYGNMWIAGTTFSEVNPPRVDNMSIAMLIISFAALSFLPGCFWRSTGSSDKPCYRGAGPASIWHADRLGTSSS